MSLQAAVAVAALHRNGAPLLWEVAASEDAARVEAIVHAGLDGAAAAPRTAGDSMYLGRVAALAPYEAYAFATNAATTLVLVVDDAAGATEAMLQATFHKLHEVWVKAMLNPLRDLDAEVSAAAAATLRAAAGVAS